MRHLFSGRSGNGAAPEPARDHASPAFGDQLDLELERSKRGAHPLSILLGEVEIPPRFRLGTVDALVVVADTVAGEKRRIDTAATIGRTRFALILPETAEQGALVLAERLRHAIARATQAGGEHISVSFGIATFPRHGRSPGALVKAADGALRAVKALGGDRSLLESAETPTTIVSVSNGDELSDQRLETVLALAETVDIRDRGSAGHSQIVGRHAEQIARELGLPVREADRVRLAGLLHDVGNVGIPVSLLQKPGGLEANEWEQVRKHPEIGARLVDDPEFADVSEFILTHQERPDGDGYPRGLKGSEIPLGARIVAVADAYESMTCGRPYRGATPAEAAQADLIECAGTQFDRRVVEAFMRVLEREGERVRSGPIPTA